MSDKRRIVDYSSSLEIIPNRLGTEMTVESPTVGDSLKKSPDSDSCDNDTATMNYPSPLLSLPQEIWSMIMEYIPQEDRINQRLVNRQWCKAIDEGSTFNIVFNEVTSSLHEYVLNLRIRACEFSGLKRGFELKLKHPFLVREITVGPYVTKENLRTILKTCVNVEQLRFFQTAGSEISFVDNEIDSFEFLSALKKLRSIQIGLLFFGGRSPTAISSTFGALIADRRLVFPSLREVIVQCAMTSKEWRELLRFFERHSSTLRRLSLSQCICDVKVSDDDDSLNLEKDTHRVDYISSCKISSLEIMRVSSCHCGGASLWSNLLFYLSEVKKLCTNLICDVLVMKDFIDKNRRSLQSLILSDISLGADAVINGNMFEECSELQELSLHAISCSVMVIKFCGNGYGALPDPICKRYSEFIGLQFLPSSLQRLSITGCDIAQAALEHLITKVPRLQELHLGDPGCPSRNGYGMSLDMFLSLVFNIPSLNKLSIHQNFINKLPVGSLDATEIESRWNAVILKMDKFGCIIVPSYGRLCKRTKQEVFNMDFLIINLDVKDRFALIEELKS